jgi:serine/threonine protein phosphatase PrpC
VQCNEELDYTNFDVNLSGSTVCTVIFNGTKVYCANAGDSRAIKVAILPAEPGSLTRKSKNSSIFYIFRALNRSNCFEYRSQT